MNTYLCNHCLSLIRGFMFSCHANSRSFHSNQFVISFLVGLQNIPLITISRSWQWNHLLTCLLCAWVVRPKVWFNYDQQTHQTLYLFGITLLAQMKSHPRYLLGLQEPGFYSSKGKGGRYSSHCSFFYLMYVYNYYKDSSQ
jgi:hypothetical protein